MTAGCSTQFVAYWTRSDGTAVTYKARTQFEAWSALLSLATHDEKQNGSSDA